MPELLTEEQKTAKRFWAKGTYAAEPHPDLGTHCLEWTGDKTNGYGRFRTGNRAEGTRKRSRAHRVSWELVNGPIPKGCSVLHHCANHGCINPVHLYLSGTEETQAYNVAKGSGHYRSKLTEEDVKYMRAVIEASTDDTVQDKKKWLTEEYQITRTYLNRILNRKAWTHC